MRWGRSVFALALVLATATAELVTMVTLGGASVAAISYYSYCYLVECCNEDNVPYNLRALRQSLNQDLFGQPLVQEVLHVLADHRNRKSNKALTMSFHGWPGVGKTFVSRLIVETLYKKGYQSRFVKTYTGVHSFPRDNDIAIDQLRSEIKKLVTSCPNAIIIFEEVDEIPPGILNCLRPMLDYHGRLDDVDYSKAIFIFITNVAGDEISETYLKLNKPRDEMLLSDFDKVIRETTYKEIGGLQESANIRFHLIDHFIPFLPLEESHIEQCVDKEFRDRGVHPSQEMISAAMSIIQYGPPSNPIFSNSGCKRIKMQVGLIIQKLKYSF